MLNSEYRMMVCLRHGNRNYFVFWILHFVFPRHWGRYKKYPSPEKNQGWDTVIAVFHGSTLVAPAGATH